MRMRLMLLGGGNALGQALIRLGAEEDIHFWPRVRRKTAGTLRVSRNCSTTPDRTPLSTLRTTSTGSRRSQSAKPAWLPRNMPSNGWPNCASITASPCSNLPVIASSTVRGPRPTAKRRTRALGVAGSGAVADRAECAGHLSAARAAAFRLAAR